MHSRRLFISCVAAASLAGCASGPAPGDANLPPIIFVHGNGDTSAIWQTTIWRFESNGWPRARLFAPEQPYPLARDVDSKPQAGRSSTVEHAAWLDAEVEKVRKATGAWQVVLMGVSRGGYAIRNYIQNGKGTGSVKYAVLGGVPNHGVQAIPGFNEGNEFSGTGPFLKGLNGPKNDAGDEVAGPVQWLTIRSDFNDKYAQPDGLWLGARGTPTHITFVGPELKGATNIVLPRVDHRETALSPQAFAAAYKFIAGRPPQTTDVTPEKNVLLRGHVTGLGVASTDPASGNFPNNLPLPGAQLQVFAVDANTGERRGAAVYTRTIPASGQWGPMVAQPQTPYEFVISAPGYATTHIYRAGFPRSSNIVHMHPERIAEIDKHAPAIVTMVRARGYLDPLRDKMALDGITPPPGAVIGAGVANSRIKPTGLPRAVTAEFNGERVTGRSWPASENQVTILELTY
jgi:triacylglycerol lipase